jgi:hypothetical protein
VLPAKRTLDGGVAVDPIGLELRPQLLAAKEGDNHDARQMLTALRHGAAGLLCRLLIDRNVIMRIGNADIWEDSGSVLHVKISGDDRTWASPVEVSQPAKRDRGRSGPGRISPVASCGPAGRSGHEDPCLPIPKLPPRQVLTGSEPRSSHPAGRSPRSEGRRGGQPE